MHDFSHKFFAAISLLALPMTALADFPDVDYSNSHAVAIETLVDQEVLQGYEDGTFKPDQEVNRAEALKIILLGLGINSDMVDKVDFSFSDVSSTDWFYPHVSAAVSLGVVRGYEDGSFKPNQTVNRAEAIKMLLEAAEISVTYGPSFPDVDTHAWYSPYASYAKTWNIEPAQTDGLWHGEEDVTRGNIAELVYRLQTVKESGVAFDESSNWLTKDFPTVEISMKIPFGWGYKQDGVGAVFLLDSEHGQLSMLSPYENGGTLLMTRYANTEGQSASSLFASVKANTVWETEQTKINGYSALIVKHEEGLYYREWYVFLPNERLVHLLALRGEGNYSSTLEDHFERMIASVEYSARTNSGLSVDEIVEALRGAIQVDGVGAEMMGYLNDWKLIETDSIGVGTGPVDYYYSSTADITIKYERSYDVILNLREGETSAF